MNASLDAKLASHLKTIRQSRALSLDALAHLSGISRATLSRIENGDTSPTAAHLGKLAAAHSVPVSHLLAQVESAPVPMVRANDQKEWTDPETGFVRRGVSPPAENLTGEVIEGHLPAGQTISYHAPTISGQQHHVLLQTGRLQITIDTTVYLLEAGDTLRYRLFSPSQFQTGPDMAARYFLILV